LERKWLQHWPKNVPQSIDYPNVSLGELFTQSASRTPNSVAIIFQETQITYQELEDLVDRFGRALQDLGIGKGDRVAIILPNTPQFVIAYYGALRIGAIVVACSPLYKEREISHILADSEARILIFLDKLHPYVQAAKEKTRVEQIISTSLDDFGTQHLKPTAGEPAESTNMRQLIDTAGPLKTQNLDSKHDAALFQYTGGTTGTPKAAILTHYNLVVNAVQFAKWLYMKNGKEVQLSVLPFFHIYGMTTSLNSSIYTSSTMVLIPDPRDSYLILESIDKYEPTIFCGVPASYMALIDNPNIKHHRLQSIRTCISGASPLPQALQRRFEELTGGRLVEGYGLTEASPVTHVTPLDDPGKNRPGSIGIPISDTECKIVDSETGLKDLPPLEAGELVIRGPQVMKGYWKRPEETSLVLRNGWLFTGDIAIMDSDGYFRIVDRKKDMINVSGFKVWPREVEDVLCEHPAVKEAAAVAAPDGESGEVVKAFVVLKETFTQEHSPSDIVAFCQEKIANYKAPRIVEIVQSLPKSTTGKILRRELRKQRMS
jgi:long-chain acyl-CoA synthetase